MLPMAEDTVNFPIPNRHPSLFPPAPKPAGQGLAGRIFPSCFLFQFIAVPILPHHPISPVRIKVNVHNDNQDYNADFCKAKIIPHSGEIQAEKCTTEAAM